LFPFWIGHNVENHLETNENFIKLFISIDEALFIEWNPFKAKN